jgi:3-oxoacyl-[acyl-carrier protein] reductase
MNLGLEGKYALVTGGSHGIGRAIAIELANEGCNVCIVAREISKLEETNSLIRGSAPVDTLCIQEDLTDSSAIEKIVSTIESTWGKLHILINNVGGGGRWGQDQFHEVDYSLWSEVYEKNTGTAIRCTNAFLPFMLKEEWGRVIHISSIYGREGGGRPWFNMAKSAQISHAKCMSKSVDLVRKGITFNVVSPGAIMIPDTGWDELRKKSPQSFIDQMESDYPLGRLGKPEEVASLVCYLCSERASLINGACITADGGQSHSF